MGSKEALAVGTPQLCLVAPSIEGHQGFCCAVRYSDSCVRGTFPSVAQKPNARTFVPFFSLVCLSPRRLHAGINWINGKYKTNPLTRFDIAHLSPLSAVLPLPHANSPISPLPLMVYIPFASLLGIQAALDSFAPKPEKPVLEADSVTLVDFANPKLAGGSWLDKDFNSGLGEPLNVSLSALLPSL
jgi:hypothetical protein